MARSDGMNAKRRLPWIGALASLFVAFIFASPKNTKLDWDNYVLPLANKFVSSRGLGQKQEKVLWSETPLDGVNVVITGATSGIGLGLTKVMTRLGAHVIAIGRNSTKLQRCRDDLVDANTGTNDAAGTEKGQISLFTADFGDLQAVSNAADQILKKFSNQGGIDILINNAGIHESFNLFEKNKSVQGFDNVFTVNYLSHALLTEKLIPLIKKSKLEHPAILQVTSSYHLAGNCDDLMPKVINQNQPLASIPGGAPANYIFRAQRAYTNSKLAQILYARALKRDYSKDAFRVVNACPGWVGTHIMGASGSLMHTFFKLFAFEYDGHGVASCLFAIFDKESSKDNDYYINSGITHRDWFYTRFLLRLPFAFCIRDLFINLFAIYLLFAQRFVAKPEPTETLPEAYDIDIQDPFYDWTKKTLQEWM